MEEFRDILDPSMSTWTCDAPLVESKRLLGIHKYKDMSRVRPVIMKAADSSREQAQLICEPIGCYKTLRIAVIDADGVALENGDRFQCGAFQKRLSDCTHIVVFVITLGPELDTAVSEGFERGDDPLGPLFLDTAGWLSIEAVTRELTKFIKHQSSKSGYDVTIRMAPGYSYREKNSGPRQTWRLEEQAKLFNVFGDSKLPVTLLESSAMLPRMSRSGIFGLRARDL